MTTTLAMNGVKKAAVSVEERTARLLKWTSSLTFNDIPVSAVARTKAFLVDTIACTIAGQKHPAVKAFLAFSDKMGPRDGPCQYIFNPSKTTSAAFAVLVNGAASHVVEQDDLNNAGMIHPATVVFPAAIAAAQDVGCSGEEFMTACVAGYEVANRVGEFLGKKHYHDFHTTSTAGTFAAAATVARILKLDFQKTLWAFGSAGTQSAGLWQFLSDGTHSKQLHTSKANFNGLLSAYAAKDGLTGTSDILGGKRGMAAYMCDDTYPDALDQNLGKRWTVLETSFKWHASCRHTHPSVDGLLEIMTKHNIQFEDIQRVECGVYQAAIDVLGDGVETVHQSKFSMGFVIAVAAKYGRAGITDFTEAKLKEKDLLEFMTKVEMILDDEINAAFPKEWMAVVRVTTKGGRKYETKMETPKGDPNNTLTKEEIDSKARGLFRYGGWTDAKAQDELINKLWEIEKEMKVTL